MHKIAAIIPVYNRLEITKIGLFNFFSAYDNYLENNDFINLQVIIVDDDSTDGTSEWIRNNYSEIIIIKGNGNLWWSGSINIGIKYCENLDYQYIMLWNDDVRPKENFFIELEELLKNTSYHNTILASKVIIDDGSNTIFHAGCLFNSKTGEKTLLRAGQIDDSRFDEIREIDWCGGMGVLIPKSTFEKIGYFDNINFPQYHADADFMLRAKKNGIPIVIFPRLIVYNNIKTTGLNNKNISTAIKALTSLRSNFNIRRNIVFYKKHAESKYAYLGLFKKYLRFLLGAIRNTLKQIFN